MFHDSINCSKGLVNYLITWLCVPYLVTKTGGREKRRLATPAGMRSLIFLLWFMALFSPSSTAYHVTIINERNFIYLSSLISHLSFWSHSVSFIISSILFSIHSLLLHNTFFFIFIFLFPAILYCSSLALAFSNLSLLVYYLFFNINFHV